MQTKRALKTVIIALVAASAGLAAFFFLSDRYEDKSGEVQVVTVDPAAAYFKEKGGIRMLINTDIEGFVHGLAKNRCEEFYQAFNAAKEKNGSSENCFVDLFEIEWDRFKGNRALADVFEIEGTDDEVLVEIRRKVSEAIDRSIGILSIRAGRLGIVKPNIQRVNGSDRILVELPEEDNFERATNITHGNSIEFWTTLSGAEIVAQILDAEKQIIENDPSAESIEKKLDLSQHVGACVGHAKHTDTTDINDFLKRPEVKSKLNPDFIPMWSAKPNRQSGLHELVAADNNFGKGAGLDGDAIEKASAEFSQISLEMNDYGAKKWERITRENIGKQIAIVLDGLVYSYPVVNDVITGGMSSISGDFTEEEARDLANLINCGKLPISLSVIKMEKVNK